MNNVIKMATVISTDIRSRKNAEILKSMIHPGSKVMLDFQGVTFISRSVADEICDIIEHSKATVDKSNMCLLVENMLRAVENGRNKKRERPEIDDKDIIICKDMESLSRVLLS
jgi:hypothetical protein